MGLFKLIKNYKELGHVEFMNRWKEGMKQVNPAQQVNGQLLFIKITLVGTLLGFLVSLWKWKETWWLAIILFGTMGQTWFQYKALKAQKKVLDEMFKVNNNQEETNV